MVYICQAKRGGESKNPAGCEDFFAAAMLETMQKRAFLSLKRAQSEKARRLARLFCIKISDYPELFASVPCRLEKLHTRRAPFPSQSREIFFQILRAIGALPRKAVPSEMTVRGGLRVNGISQSQRADNGVRAQVEFLFEFGYDIFNGSYLAQKLKSRNCPRTRKRDSPRRSRRRPVSRFRPQVRPPPYSWQYNG